MSDIPIILIGHLVTLTPPKSQKISRSSFRCRSELCGRASERNETKIIYSNANICHAGRHTTEYFVRSGPTVRVGVAIANKDVSFFRISFCVFPLAQAPVPLIAVHRSCRPVGTICPVIGMKQLSVGSVSHTSDSLECGIMLLRSNLGRSANQMRKTEKNVVG